MADFVHVTPDGVLSLIHVKGANNNTPTRRVALTAFEVVVSQAVKNLVYTDRDELIRALSTPRLAQPACWDLGKRSSSRSELIEALELRDATNPTQVVIVQPHMSLAVHERLRGRNRSSGVSDDLLRLRLLEELLNGARSSVTEVANDLTVIGSLT